MSKRLTVFADNSGFLSSLRLAHTEIFMRQNTLQSLETKHKFLKFVFCLGFHDVSYYIVYIVKSVHKITSSIVNDLLLFLCTQGDPER